MNTDFVRVGTAANQFHFADLGWDSQITPAGSYVGVLDLGAILPDLQSGAVNVQVNDDSGVDWALYVVTVATPTANPDGTTVFIDGGGTATVDSSVGLIGNLHVGGSGTGTLDLTSVGQAPVSGDYDQSAAARCRSNLPPQASGRWRLVAPQTWPARSRRSLKGGFDPAAGDSFEIIERREYRGRVRRGESAFGR